jgi:hypothetical protein
LGGWFIATVVGGWIGLVINGVLLALGILDIWERLKGSWESFKSWFSIAYKAENEADLDRASKALADALASGGLLIIELVVLHYTFRAVEAALLKRFPTPEWIRRDYRSAVKKEQARRSAEQKRKQDTQKPPEEKPPEEKPPEEKPPEEKPPEEKPPEKKPPRSIEPAIELLGANRAADALESNSGWLGLGALALFGAWLLSRRRRA